MTDASPSPPTSAAPPGDHAPGPEAAAHDHDHGQRGCDHGAGGHDHGTGGHDHAHGPGGHGSLAELRRASSRALWIALIVLGVFFVVEMVGGVLTNSLALISDAFHLLSDVAAVGLALFAQWFARKPPSSLRSFGYRRVEILAALFNGFTLMIIALFIAVEAYHRLRQPQAVLGWPMVIIAAVGLVAQTVTALVLGRAQGESLNVRGAYLHALTDAVQSVGVVIAGVVILATSWALVDPLVSVLIAALVFWSGVKIILEASHVLIEGTPRELDLERIARMIGETPGVLRVADLHAWSITSGYNALSAHLVAQPTAGGDQEELCRRLTRELCGRFPLQHVTLQIERECATCRTEGCGDWLVQHDPEPPHR